MELSHFLFFFFFLSKFNIDDTQQPHNKTINCTKWNRTCDSDKITAERIAHFFKSSKIILHLPRKLEYEPATKQ